MRFGRYEALSLIARGGMAKVYLGRALGVGGFQRKVAIKVMHEHIAAEPQFVNMFLDEARLAALIHHPNVVSTLDIQHGDQGLYLVMEYVEGASLDRIAEVIKSGAASLPISVVLRIMVDALAGLHAAHELTGPDGAALRVVHRDVSPQNVLVGVDGISRITDFGVARAETRISSTREGMVKGKLGYMAVEQLKAQKLDRRTDVYAAGVVLWELLTGRPLFMFESQAAMVHAVLMGPETKPSQSNPLVPAELDDVCMRALCGSREDRFPTAEAFSQALSLAAARAGLLPAPPSQVGGFAKSAYVEPKDLLAAPSQPSLESSALTQRAQGDPIRGHVQVSGSSVTLRAHHESHPSVDSAALTHRAFAGSDTHTVRLDSGQLPSPLGARAPDTITQALPHEAEATVQLDDSAAHVLRGFPRDGQREGLAFAPPDVDAQPSVPSAPHYAAPTTMSGSIAAIAHGASRPKSHLPVVVGAAAVVLLVGAGIAYLMSSSAPAPAPVSDRVATEPTTEVSPGATIDIDDLDTAQDPDVPVASASQARTASPPKTPLGPAPKKAPAKKPGVEFDPLKP